VITAVPESPPDTLPADPTDATDGKLLLHVPPLTESVYSVLVPAQITEAPDITDGVVLTVIAFVVKHPVGSV
jgi:hypothetical protein